MIILMTALIVINPISLYCRASYRDLLGPEFVRISKYSVMLKLRISA